MSTTQNYYTQLLQEAKQSVNSDSVTQFTESELDAAVICLEALANMNETTLQKFEEYLLQEKFQQAGFLLEASILETQETIELQELLGIPTPKGKDAEGISGYINKLGVHYANKTDTKAALTRDAKRKITDFFSKPSTATKVKRVVGDEIEDTVGSIKRLFSKKGENKDGIFMKKADKDAWDKFQNLKDIKQVGKVAAVAAGAGLAAWGAYKGGKALYSKLKSALSNWKSGSAQRDPKKTAAAAQQMAAVMKKAPPKAIEKVGTQVMAPKVAQAATVAKKTATKSGEKKPEPKSSESGSDKKPASSKSSSSSSGGGNPDNWGGKRRGAGRPEGS